MNNKWNLLQGKKTYQLYKEWVIDFFEDCGEIHYSTYVSKINELLRKEGTPQEGEDIESYLIDPNKFKDVWRFSNLSSLIKAFEKTKTFKGLTLLQKRHYLFMIRGVVFEERIAKENPEWKRTEYEMDFESGIDFYDETNKVLYSVKCSKSIQAEHLEKINEYFSKEENKQTWKGYQVKILLNNNERNTILNVLKV